MFPVYIPVYQPGNTPFLQYADARLTHFQLISELDITGGDEKKVGYYAGKREQPIVIRTPDPESRF